MFNFFISRSRDYIFIFLTATIFFSTFSSEVFADKKIFIINEVNVQGKYDVSFSRNKYINKAFKKSFLILMSKILVSNDFNKIKNVNLKEIKNLIRSFQIVEESYFKKKYTAKYKIHYNESKVKKLLIKNNISYSQPKNISAVFYPVLFINDSLQDFRNNYFYQQWTETKIENETISFILPIEDLDDINQIKKNKNQVENLNINNLIKKYNTNNYVFALMQKNKKKLQVYLKTNFNKNKISKNLVYNLNDINNVLELQKILIDLKMQSIDIWKKENIVNLSIPLSIKVKYKGNDLSDIDKLKTSLSKIDIIDNFFLEEINNNYVFFKINYFGSPKKLKVELFSLGYILKNYQGNWLIQNE